MQENGSRADLPPADQSVGDWYVECGSRKALANVADTNGAIKEEVESFAWCVAKTPTCDLHGHPSNAALFALIADLELGKPSDNAKEAVHFRPHS
jgi:hypothetical protein